MKNFFEFLGFLSTALFSGVLVFTYIGHSKNADGGAKGFFAKESAETASTGADTETFTDISKMTSKKKSARHASEAPESISYNRRETAEKSSASAREKLAELYEDEAFVNAAVKQWKRRVADAYEVHSIRPQLLLSNALIRSYLGNYSEADFKRDIAEHAGDVVRPISTAMKSYDYGWSMQRLISRYNLSKHFPGANNTAVAVEAKPVKNASSYAAPAKVTAAPKTTARSVAATAPAEAGFRDMVAKEYGFTSWNGLMRLGDPESKQNAARRVKMLTTAARVR